MPTNGKDSVLCSTSDADVLGVAVSEIAVLSGVGKGAMVMRSTTTTRSSASVLGLGARDEITSRRRQGRT